MLSDALKWLSAMKMSISEVHDQDDTIPFISNATGSLVFSAVLVNQAVSRLITFVRWTSVEDEHVHQTAPVIRTVID